MALRYGMRPTRGGGDFRTVASAEPPKWHSSMLAESAFNELIGPDILSSVQWHGAVDRNDWCSHCAKRLMLAVLVDALRCLQRCAGGRTVIQRRTLAEVEEWIAEREARGTFAFESVCDTLGINPDFLRDGLHRWRQLQLNGINANRHMG